MLNVFIFKSDRLMELLDLLYQPLFKYGRLSIFYIKYIMEKIDGVSCKT